MGLSNKQIKYDTWRDPNQANRVPYICLICLLATMPIFSSLGQCFYCDALTIRHASRGDGSALSRRRRRIHTARDTRIPNFSRNTTNRCIKITARPSLQCTFLTANTFLYFSAGCKLEWINCFDALPTGVYQMGPRQGRELYPRQSSFLFHV
jgi:hypothetical protein